MPTPREQIVKIDYRKLLMKYIQYIVEMEGTDYLGYDRRPPIFSGPEWNELRGLTVGFDLVTCGPWDAYPSRPDGVMGHYEEETDYADS